MRAVWVGLFVAASVASVSIFGPLIAAAPVRAENCPGHPDAIGTSRVIAIQYGDYAKLGRLQYPQTLPLADHEVVLTFDDGPMRLLSEKALDILDSQCVKVTYFLIGEMAHYFPDIVRREYASGDVIGTHSEHHPLPFNKLSDQQAQQEIDEGIASVGAALGDPKELAPFFRIPGFGRNDMIEQELAERMLIVFSTDVVAEDWLRHIKPAQIVQRAMSRLEKRGGGILLLHDIHPATVLALPDLLEQLKTHGFHIVQVVPVGPGTPETPPVIAAASPQTTLAAMPDATNIDRESSALAWPALSLHAVGDDIALAAPDASDFDIKDKVDFARADGAEGPPWPRPAEAAPLASSPQLPAPSLSGMGVSLRGRQLVGVEHGPQPGAEAPAAIERRHPIEHEQVRHVHFQQRLNSAGAPVHHGHAKRRLARP